MGSETSSYGVSKRESHDSSAYYLRKINISEGFPSVEPKPDQPFPKQLTNTILNDSCIGMGQESTVPENSVHLMITSPPYGVGKDYDDDLDLNEFLEMLYLAWLNTYSLLVDGGRACINVANIGRKPYIPLHACIIQQMLQIGFRMRGEIIWDKGSSAGSSTAWGSWKSASNPTLRDQHEYILIFSKASFARDKSVSTISKDSFLDNTRSVWQMNTESAKKIGHPAPFPIELPHRLIDLYSFENDVVYDPFMGSGTTAVAAVRTGRRYFGYEVNPEYHSLSEKRIMHAEMSMYQQSLLP